MSSPGQASNNGRRGLARNASSSTYNHYGAHETPGRAIASADWRVGAAAVNAGNSLGSPTPGGTMAGNIIPRLGDNIMSLYTPSGRRDGTGTGATQAVAGVSMPYHPGGISFGGNVAPGPPAPAATRMQPTATAFVPGHNDFAGEGPYGFYNGPSESFRDSIASDYAYCIQRQNGAVVPLIPADLLPRLRGVPPVIQDARNVYLLPTLDGLAPSGRSYYHHAVEVVGFSPIQTHIDNVVAGAGPSKAGPKKTKIYCDKWIHDGTCAFTQQGCKYKHEMPFDKETQVELGLFHGLPFWWKKQQAELQKQQAELQRRHGRFPEIHGPSASMERNAAPGLSIARQNESVFTSPPGYEQRYVPMDSPTNFAQGPNVPSRFGAIGTRRQTTTNAPIDPATNRSIATSNPFASLTIEDADEETKEENDTH